MVAADLSLPPLRKLIAGDGQPFVQVIAGRQGPTAAVVDWRHHWRNAVGGVDLSLARVCGQYLLRFPDLADFLLREPGEIEVRAFSDVPSHTIQHLLLDQVLPRWMAHRGTMVLHASAIVTAAGQAIIALGASGAGKSTLAAALAASAGGHVLADDCVFVTSCNDRWLALPAYSGLRLWPDSLGHMFPGGGAPVPVNDYTDKQRVGMPLPPDPPHADGWPISAMLVLEPQPAQQESGRGIVHSNLVDCSVLPGARACIKLIGNSFQLDPGDMAAVAGLLAQASGLAARIPLVAVAYPRQFRILAHVAAEILARVGAEP